MNVTPVVHQIIMLFLLMCIGLMLRKNRTFSDPVIKGMNALVLNITWPALMIFTTQKDYAPQTLNTFLLVLAASAVLVAVCCLVAYLVCRKLDKQTAPVVAMLMTMPNVGFFGIPIVEALYGSQGLLYLAAYIVGFNIVLWTLGVSLFTGLNAKALRNLANPALICAMIGIALFVLKIRLPAPLLSTVDKLSAINTPLSMLILGSRMDQLDAALLRDQRLWMVALAKLVLMPLAALLSLRLFGITGMVLVILVAGAAMPSAASTQMMAERYGGDVHFSAKATAVNTLCSMVTLPLMLYLAGLVS